MKYLKVLSLIIILAFSTAVLAQEKGSEKPKKKPAEKQVEKSKEDKLDNVFRKSNNPDGFIISHSTLSRRAKVFHNPLPDITDVELIFDETIKDESNNDLCFPDKLPGIEVVTKATNPNSDALIYHYVVSSGKIIGKGEKVIWDVSGVKPGTYTITAAVDDGCGFCGKTQTKTVIVKE